MPLTVLITGSNKGIGFETARQLAEKSCKVFISGRDKGRLNLAAEKLLEHGLKTEALLMDVSDPESVKAAADKFRTYGIGLDVLINNAAILYDNDNKISEDDTSLYEKTIQTNCRGPLEVVKNFTQFMNQPARIINLSSGGGSMSDPVGGWAPAYCVSKSLLNSITRQLAYELQSARISVNAACPGWVKTDMGGSSANRTVVKGAETPVWLAIVADGSITGKFFRDKKQIPW